MPSTYTPIATQTLGSSASSVTFSSISGSYTDLVLVMSVQDNSSGTNFSNVQVQFNNDTGTNYSWTELYGNGSSALSQRASNYEGCWAGYMSSVSGVFSPIIFNVMNYSNTTTFKTTLSRANLGAQSPNTTTVTEAVVSTWRSTSAITTLKVNGAISFIAGSTFTLYGVKSA